MLADYSGDAGFSSFSGTAEDALWPFEAVHGLG